MPKDPEYSKTLTYRSGVHNFARLHGTEYEHPLQTHNHNVHCAVCCVSKVLMIPAILKPGPGSTMDILCQRILQVIMVAPCLSVWIKIRSPCLVVKLILMELNVEADCNTGLTCPPYNNHKELNCVVCTK